MHFLNWHNLLHLHCRQPLWNHLREDICLAACSRGQDNLWEELRHPGIYGQLLLHIDWPDSGVLLRPGDIRLWFWKGEMVSICQERSHLCIPGSIYQPLCWSQRRLPKSVSWQASRCYYEFWILLGCHSLLLLLVFAGSNHNRKLESWCLVQTSPLLGPPFGKLLLFNCPKGFILKLAFGFIGAMSFTDQSNLFDDLFFSLQTPGYLITFAFLYGCKPQFRWTYSVRRAPSCCQIISDGQVLHLHWWVVWGALQLFYGHNPTLDLRSSRQPSANICLYSQLGCTLDHRLRATYLSIVYVVEVSKRSLYIRGKL